MRIEIAFNGQEIKDLLTALERTIDHFEEDYEFKTANRMDRLYSRINSKYRLNLNPP